ncbi:MAG: hypothetical protein IT514_15085 [Burkholderiales bacterium]|nr:hypothetical protein [Burkholderiales bacterium]
MAFKLVSNPEFTASVKVRVPTEGGHADGSFTARFRALSTSEASAFDRLSDEGLADYLRAILIGWEGVVDDAGATVSFSDAARDRLIDAPFVQVPLLVAYNEAMIGAKRGN